jgi:hypothetical protein
LKASRRTTSAMASFVRCCSLSTATMKSSIFVIFSFLTSSLSQGLGMELSRILTACSSSAGDQVKPPCSWLRLDVAELHHKLGLIQKIVELHIGGL